jgi:ribosomal protein S18 acetylase RimI-like enzyme
MQIRSATPKDSVDVARIQVETWRSTYSGIISARHLNGLSVQKSAQYWEAAILRAEAGKFLLVVESEGAPRGFLAGGPIREPIGEFTGEVYALYIEERYQKRSLGKAIFAAGLERLKELGMPGVAVWVLKDNPSFHFYEKMGGKLLGEMEVEIGGEAYIESGYGWKPKKDDRRPGSQAD